MVMKIAITSGKSEGPSKLNAFDNSLLDAGIGDVNLIKVSSIIPADSEFTLNLQANSQPSNEVALIREGTTIYLLGDPFGANGFIYVCGYYQESL